MAAFWRLVALLALLVVVLGVLTASWDVALGTARVALVVLLLVATWLYGVWFVRQRAELNRRDELERPPVPDYRPR